MTRHLEIDMKKHIADAASQVPSVAREHRDGRDAKRLKLHRTLSYAVSVALLASAAQARAVPTDISGTYSCVGHDENLGDFRETHEFRPNRHHGTNTRGFSEAAYLGDQLAYTGEAIVDGDTIALNFQSASDKNDHGVLLGKIDQKTPIRFKGEYFESKFKDGDTGTATCTRSGN